MMMVSVAPTVSTSILAVSPLSSFLHKQRKCAYTRVTRFYISGSSGIKSISSFTRRKSLAKFLRYSLEIINQRLPWAQSAHTLRVSLALLFQWRKLFPVLPILRILAKFLRKLLEIIMSIDDCPNRKYFIKI